MPTNGSDATLLRHKRVQNDDALVGEQQFAASGGGGGEQSPPHDTSSPATFGVAVTRQKALIDFGFLVALGTNPLIIASVVAVIVHMINGPTLPKFITRFSNTIAASFASPALFVVGLSMYGKFELLYRSPRDLLLSSVLVLTKELVLPNLMRTLALIILPRFTSNASATDLNNLIDFSFLYGLLPVAPGACIIARQYDILTNVVSISMLLSTFISAPLMLGAATIINPSSALAPIDIEALVSETIKAAGLITMVLAALTLYNLRKQWLLTNYRNFGRSATRVRDMASARTLVIVLVGCQMLIGCGGMFWCVAHESVIHATKTLLHITDTGPPPSGAQMHEFAGFNTLVRLQYVVTSAALIMSKFLVLMIALLVAAEMQRGRRATNFVHWLVVRVGIGFALITTLWLAFDSTQFEHRPAESSLPERADSLYVRLACDIIVIASAAPLLTMLFTKCNKYRHQTRFFKTIRQSSAALAKAAEANGVARRQPKRKLNGGASFCSTTSSALTMNTNIINESPQITIDDSHAAAAAYALAQQRNARTSANNYDARSQPDKRLHTLSGAAQAANQTTTKQQSCCEISINDIVSAADATHHMGQHMSVKVPDSLVTIARDCCNDTDAEKAGVACCDAIAVDYASSLSCESNDDCGLHDCTNYDVESSSASSNSDCAMSNISSDNAHDNASLPSTTASYNAMTFISTHTSYLNKLHVLIVYMLIDAILNMMAISQKLLQHPLSGTFKQIEVISVAFEFGQGIMTFLLFGVNGLFN